MAGRLEEYVTPERRIRASHADVPSRQRAKRLLIVINVDWFFVSHRLPIAQAALAAGWDVHVATKMTEPIEQLKRHGFVVHPLRLERSDANPVAILASALEIFRLFSKVDPDVVHLVTIKPVLLGGLAARLARVPAVVFAFSGLGHVFSSNGIRGRARRVLVVGAYRLALGVRRRKLLFQNEWDMSTIVAATNASRNECVLIPGSGFDVDAVAVSSLPKGKTKYLMASRLLRSKGVLEFVEAAKILSRERQDVLFQLVGEVDSSNPASLTPEEFEEIASSGYVEVLGFRRDVPDLIRDSHVVVLPSYYAEGLPKVLIEAAALARAVVTTDMPGCKAAVDEGRTGILVPPQSVDDLVDALRLLADDRDLVQKMGQAGRQRAEAIFRVQDVVQTHLRIYDELSGGSL